LRIVGGEARGRRLRAVPGRSTRPTADRVRQSLFDLLGQRMDGLRVLDLYAGTGAMALEAVSRGAASALLIEKDPQACAVIQANIDALEYAGECRLLRDDVAGALARLRGERFDLVFSDPPYALHASQMVIDALSSNDLLVKGGRGVLESSRREPAPKLPAGFLEIASRTYGDTRVVVIGRES
jgi:16S rRNA (guanine(966)-N(2))-methyltransferase RsmD